MVPLLSLHLELTCGNCIELSRPHVDEEPACSFPSGAHSSAIFPFSLVTLIWIRVWWMLQPHQQKEFYHIRF